MTGTISMYAAFENTAKDFFADVEQGAPMHLRAYTSNPEVAALFPKSVGFGRYGDMFVKLTSNAVNGGVNETGIRRYRSLVRHAAKLGVEIVWTTGNVRNAYQTQADFEAAIA